MKILVTGAAGFVGSTLVQALCQDADIEVVGVDNISDYYSTSVKRANLEDISHQRFTFRELDLTQADCDELLSGVTHVFHQAGQPGVRKSWGRDFGAYVDANIIATQRLLEASVDSSTIRSFVYASSSSVYGDADVYPTREDVRTAPRSPYGVTKLAAENLCSLYAANFAVPTVSLRYFTVYGPRQRPDMAFNRFIRAALSGDAVPLFGDGSQIREFTYVEDIVKANILASQVGVPPGEVINLSGGASISVAEVIDLLQSIHGGRVAIDRLDAVAGDVFRTGGSTEKAKEILGWAPATGIEAGLKREYEWLSERLDLYEGA